MANAARGDVTLTVDGAPRTLRLTLGALAEIETGLGLERFEEIGPRLSAPSAADLVVVLGALLRGAGEPITDEKLRAAEIDLGQAAKAIAAAFGAGEETPGKS
ncbi:MAG: GTA-gp10 family protein [Pseudomonadota bacterium]